MIFLDLLKVKVYGNMLQKRTKLHQKKKIFLGEACPRTPLANAWLRHTSQAHPHQKNS